MALLGVDIGTSGVKAAAFDLQGNLLAQGNAPLAIKTTQPGYAQQDPRDWWTAACHAVRQVVAQIGSDGIQAVGVDGQSWAAVLLDRSGKVLCDTPLWMDQRSTAQCKALEQTFGDRAFLLSGNRFAPGYTTPKIKWYQEHQPDVFAQARYVLQSNGFIAYQLTGEITQDLSQGYGLHCFDVAKGAWDVSMAQEMGIDPALLPPLCACHQVIGRVTSLAAIDTGLLAGIPVVAGGLDAACAALGAGVVQPGQTQEQGGQAGGMGLCIDTPTKHPLLILSHHVVPNHWLLQGGTVGGGGALRWLHSILGAKADAQSSQTGISPFEILCAAADAIPAGSEGLVFLPYLSGERSPIWDEQAKGVFYGLSYRTGAAHMTRAVLEGVAFSLLHNLSIAKQAGGKVGALHAMGGAATSHVWTQIKADVTGHTMRVPSGNNATALGAAILAGVGIGLWEDFAQASSATVRFEREHHPNPCNKEIYRQTYETYLALYPALQNIHKQGETR